MKKSKLRLLTLVSGTSVLAASAFSISCSTNVLQNIQNQSLERKQKQIVRYNSTKKDKLYSSNFSNSFGSDSFGTDINYAGARFWRYQRSGETKVIDYIVKSKGENDKVWNSSSQLIVRPTFEWFTLDLIKELIITKPDGSTIIYTNSKHELMPTDDEIKKWDKWSKEGKQEQAIDEIKMKYGWNGEDVSLKIYSNDPQSINHVDFLKNMKGAAKLALIVKDVNYSDFEGNKTKYKLKAEDFYNSWLHTQLSAFDFRMQNGGVKSGEGKSAVDAIGERIKKIFNDPNINLFKHGKSYPNGYLFELFDVDLKSISKKEKTLQSVKDSTGKLQEAFVFYASDEKIGGQFNQLFFTFINDTTFVPLPTEYIIENNEKDHFDGKLNLKEYIKDTNSLAYKLGYYWYGQTLENVLYIGPYIPKKYDEFTQKKIYFQNPNYWDQEWVKAQDNIKVIQEEYKTSPLNPIEFATEQLNAYRAGLIDSIAFRDLSDTVKEELIAGVPGMPIDYSKTENKNKTLFSLFETTAPDPWYVNKVDENGNPLSKEEYEKQKSAAISKFQFNDQYSKIIYGLTREELKLEEKRISTLDAMLKTAKSFRSIYMNVANMYALADYISTGQAKPLLPGMAQDAIFKTGMSVTPRHKLNELNSTYVFDKDGNKHKFADGSILLKPDFSFLNKVGSLERLRSKYYLELQQLMKDLLDKVYKENGWSSDKKVAWRNVFRFANADAKMKDSIRNFEKLVNGLDPRLEFKLDVPSDINDLIDAVITNKGPKFFSGWGYDYEGIGQYYTSLASFEAGSFIYMLSTILKDEFENNGAAGYKTKIPELYKLALKINEKIRHEVEITEKNKDKFIYLPIDLKDIVTATNYEILHGDLEFTKTKIVDGHVEKLDPSIEKDKKQIDKIKNSNIEKFKTSLSKFFLFLQEEYSIEEHIALIQEINSIFGWDFGVQLQITTSFNKFVKNPKFITPGGSSSIPYVQDIKLVLDIK
ncbi:OppA family ABC transporter substrate-binding lipoprotein [Mycoplasma phocimorsus]|uniref:OppA family ABC transporter substrate-binding lipoprotein n=1 Tax=Mycoplasma phocimorsus TaxID=3045839 RepID=UPI0024C0C532|nr:hypothetical protein [Mycoplasma phocimorsus]MDJ1646934.1 hypothetical protein [Mycoplasma phocimorsus]